MLPIILVAASNPPLRRRYLYGMYCFGGMALLGTQGLCSQPAWGQVSAAERASTVVLPFSSEQFLIEGGDRAGDNLFHSFSEFSVPTNGIAYFNNDLAVRNIFSRVSGLSRSSIDGAIRANGAANLFLLNPNGIVFGPNAQLNIGGSFFATTANSLVFDNGTEFGVGSSPPSALLSVNVPVGLQYGSQSSSITNQGTLRLAQDRTLGLVGGSLLLDGGLIEGTGGRAELGAVAPGSFVSFTPNDPEFSLDYGEVFEFGDISLTNTSPILGFDQDIQLRGKTITADTQSSITLGLLSDNADSSIRINATEQLVLDDAILNIQTVGSGSSSSLSELAIITPRLLVQNGRGIATLAAGAGRGSDINIRANTIEMQGLSTVVGDIEFPLVGTSIATVTQFGSSGQGGQVNITADVLRVGDDGIIGATSFGTGPGGSITIQADDIELLETPAASLTSGLVTRVFPSTTNASGGDISLQARNVRIDGASISSGTLGAANSGNLTISADTLQLANQALIDTSSFGQGNSGNILLNVDQIISSDSSQIVARARASGAGGNIDIESQSLTLERFSQVRSDALSSGDAGNISIRASETIEIRERDTVFGLSGGIITTPQAGSTGEGGDIFIETPQLTLSGGGAIEAATVGEGNSGNITVVSDHLRMADEGEIVATSFAAGEGGDILLDIDRITADSGSQVASRASDTGNGGDITFNTQYLSLAGAAQVRADALGAGDAGNIFVRASDAVELSGFDAENSLFSSIVTTPQPGSTGQGGDIWVETARLSLLDGGSLGTATAGAGDSGDVFIRAEDIELSGTRLQARSGSLSGLNATVLLSGSGSGGDINVTAERIRVLNGGQLSTTTLGAGDAGTISLQVEDLAVSGSTVISEGRRVPSQISAVSETAFAAGSVDIQSERVRVEDEGLISVSSLNGGNAGSLGIAATQIELDRGGRLSAEVSQGDQGNIDLTTDLLLMRRESQVTTNATGTATGGNITFNGGLIVSVPEENSDMTANAVQGQGGNTFIRTDGLVGIDFREQLTPESDITASSEFGLDGTVDIQRVNVDPASGLVELPTGLVDGSEQVAAGCPADQGANFIATGRGGVPAAPGQALIETVSLPAFEVSAAGELPASGQRAPEGGTTVEPLVDLTMNSSLENGLRSADSGLQAAGQSSVIPDVIVEAQSWGYTAGGEIQLLSPDAIKPETMAAELCGREAVG